MGDGDVEARTDIDSPGCVGYRLITVHGTQVLRGLILLLAFSSGLVVTTGGPTSLQASVPPHREEERLVAPRPLQQPLRLRVAVAPSLQSAPGWSRDLSRAVSEASDILEPHLRRPLELIETRGWRGGDRPGTLTDLLLELFRVVPRGDADLVLGLAASADPTSETAESRGLARYEEGYAVIAAGGGLEQVSRLLAHETAHLFGAVHVNGPLLLMSPDTNGSRLDPINAALLGLHADRRFEGGVFPLRSNHLEAARSLYLQVVEADPAADAEARLMPVRPGYRNGSLRSRYRRPQENTCSRLEAPTGPPSAGHRLPPFPPLRRSARALRTTAGRATVRLPSALQPRHCPLPQRRRRRPPSRPTNKRGR